MTVATMSKFIGKKGFISLDGMTISIVIIDVRDRYGNVDFRITPADGFGSKWVLESTVTIG